MFRSFAPPLLERHIIIFFKSLSMWPSMESSLRVDSLALVHSSSAYQQRIFHHYPYLTAQIGFEAKPLLTRHCTGGSPCILIELFLWL